ncbi:hypothetical protein JCM6882_008175 [Rhodosporidiobolus microsporus]
MSYGHGYNGGYPQHQYNYSDASGPYPSGTATQNPFASSSQIDLHTPTYPPGAGGQQGMRDSTWSLDEEPLKANAVGGGGGVQRGRDNPYAADFQEKKSWRRWWVPILLGLVVIAGVVIGIVVWKTRSNDSSSSGSSGKRQYMLKQIFYGLAYTPKNVLEEYGCGATLQNVTEDIQLISQLTTRIRTYGPL